MCAEAVPWRCHRSLVADALIARGDTVSHIMGEGEERPHMLTPWAKVEGALVTYPGEPPPRRGTSNGAEHTAAPKASHARRRR